MSQALSCILIQRSKFGILYFACGKDRSEAADIFLPNPDPEWTHALLIRGKPYN
jgi:hypothetical protein